MKRLVWVLLIFLVFGLSSVSSGSMNTDTANRILGCRPLVDLLTHGGIDKFINPDMDTMSEVIQMRFDCYEISKCITGIESQGIELPESLQFIRFLTDLHLMYNSGELDCMPIQLRNSGFKALDKLQKAVKLPVPKGYAFIRIDSESGLLDRIKHPERINPSEIDGLPLIPGLGPVTTNPGVTRMVRYITIKIKKKDPLSIYPLSVNTYKEPPVSKDTLPHELVHVYINSLLGTAHFNDMPKWFDEGCALFFTDAEPEKSTSTNVGNETITTTVSLTDDYKNYLLVFQYLSQVKSEEAFSQFLTESIRTHSVKKPLFALCGTTTFPNLLSAAEHWRTINNWRVGCIIALIILLFLSIGAFTSNEKGWGGFLIFVMIALFVFTVWILPTL